MARSQSAYVKGAVVACQRDHREQQLEVTVAEWGIQDVEAALKVLPKGPVGEARYSLCDLSRDADASFAVAALDVTLQPSAGLEVLAFNSLDDEDPDGVLCTPSGDAAPGVLPATRPDHRRRAPPVPDGGRHQGEGRRLFSGC